MSVDSEYDVLVIGGGLVGAGLACALANSRLRIAVAEALPYASAQQPSYDERTIALAYGSRRIFEGLGAWRAIEHNGAYPIKRIHISDRGHFGITRLEAADAGVPALGYVAAARAIGSALQSIISEASNIHLLCPVEVQGIEFKPEAALCRMHGEAGETYLRAKLVVMADGGRSDIARTLGLAGRRKEYDQAAIVTTVTPGRSHDGTAYERFTESGPLALLPMDAERCAVVWSARQREVDTILAWRDDEFLARLQSRFGDRLGQFTKVGKRRDYPLALMQSKEYVRSRLVLIGNAAHTVHPVAGQGFNLGLRDVACLAQVLVDAVSGGRDIGDLPVLEEYAAWRRHDNRVVPGFTDGLIRIFSNRFTPLVLARNLGLLGVDMLPFLKRALTRRTSGLTGRQPRLARGLPLQS